MGINQTIFDAIMNVLNGYEDRGYCCNKGEVEGFLFPAAKLDFWRRQAEAISIVKEIMTNHGKKELYLHIAELARVERGICEPESLVKARDHVVHALLSFLLGIYINENFMKPLGCDVGPFQWKLAGLFHDIGYPAQVATTDILNPFTDKINRIKRDLGAQVPDVFFKIVPVGLDNLTNGTNSLGLIQSQLKDWGLDIDARREYKNMVDSGQICHGIISSLALLYVIDLMYQKHNPERKDESIEQNGILWGRSYFKNDVVPACAAIFVHNLPERCFLSAKLVRERAPLAFLLKLSDCLQDWERPNADYPDGIHNDKFDIKVINRRLVFTVADKERRDEIAKEVKSFLIATDVDVCQKGN